MTTEARWLSLAPQRQQPATVVELSPKATSARCWAEAVIESSRDIVLALQADGTIGSANPAVHRILGLDRAQLPGSALLDLVHLDDTEAFLDWLDRAGSSLRPGPLELRCQHSDGGWVAMEALATLVLAGTAAERLVVTLRDVSERRILEAELTHWAFHDPLTNLINRTGLRDRLTDALHRCAVDGSMLAVLLIDLDNFKRVNDALGPRQGDRMLVSIAERLSAAIGPQDVAARLGGDEFVVLTELISAAGDCDQLAARLLAAVAEPLTLGATQLHPRASIGVRLVGPEQLGSDADQLLRDADLAMYTAKAAGKATWRTFHPDMHSVAERELTIRSELRRAILESQFVLCYQPIVEVASGEVTGFEALIRWWHPTRGFVPPDQFIPAAEESDLIVPIGAWVLRTACLAAAELRRVSGRELSMSINVSPRQLRCDDIIDTVREAADQAAVPTSSLFLEITESVLEDEDGLIDRLNRLRGLGVHLAIDDFGTGFSSYSHLQRLPVDTIKIDRSFIEQLGPDGGKPALARSIVAMGLSLGLSMVAEGVETLEQQAELVALGCPRAQGYLFARPLPLAEALALVTDPPTITGPDER